MSAPASATRDARSALPSASNCGRVGDCAGIWAEAYPRPCAHSQRATIYPDAAPMSGRGDYQDCAEGGGAPSSRASRGRTSTGLRAPGRDHLHASTNEMVAGRLPSSHGRSDPVQPQAGPSTLHDNLAVYTHDPRNLVIDSIDPDVPHIVITRPEATWDEMYISAQNRVEYQWPTFLAVPPPDRGYVSAARHPLDIPLSSPYEYDSSHYGDDCSTSSRRRRRLPPAFSKAHFNEMIDYAVWDRESYPEVVACLLRRMYILSVAAAVDESLLWRQAYDEPEWVCPAEQPFQWVDAAEAVLPSLRGFRGTTVLDSIAPLRTPHIVINEPPPANPWVGFFNIPSDPQDAAFGARLTVPWPRVVNAVPDVYEEYADEPDVPELWMGEDSLAAISVSDTNADDTGDESDASEDVSDCESRPDTPGPDTPLDEPLPSLPIVKRHDSAWLAVPDVRRRPRQLSL